MSLEDKDKIPTTPDTPAQGAGERTPAPDHNYGHHKPLTAEKIYDFSLYGIWNYGIQVGASVLAGMWFKEGGGKPYFNKAADWMGKNVMSKITSKTGAAAAKESHTWLIFGALITVGNLFIPPIQYIEHRKHHVVSKINDWLNNWRTARGDAPNEKELQEQQETIAAIAAEPQQTSASLWGGRIAGLSANFLAAHIVGRDRNIVMENATANAVSKGLEAVGATKLAKSENVKNFSRIAFLDYGYSVISASVVYLYSHYINPPKYVEKPVAESAETRHEATPKPLLSQRKEPLTPRPELLSGSTITPSEALHDHALAL